MATEIKVQSWSLLDRCPKCGGQLAAPYKATTAEHRLIHVDVRCPDCRHEWQMERTEPIFNPRLGMKRD